MTLPVEQGQDKIKRSKGGGIWAQLNWITPSNNIQQVASLFQHFHSEDQILLNGGHPLSAQDKMELVVSATNLIAFWIRKQLETNKSREITQWFGKQKGHKCNIKTKIKP